MIALIAIACTVLVAGYLVYLKRSIKRSLTSLFKDLGIELKENDLLI